MTEIDENQQPNGYEVIVTGIKWNKNKSLQYTVKNSKYEDLPSLFTMTLPENVLNQAKKAKNCFNDIVETFIYNFLTRKHGYEVNYCQIWLPLEEQS